MPGVTVSCPTLVMHNAVPSKASLKYACRSGAWRRDHLQRIIPGRIVDQTSPAELAALQGRLAERNRAASQFKPGPFVSKVASVMHTSVNFRLFFYASAGPSSADSRLAHLHAVRRPQPHRTQIDDAIAPCQAAADIGVSSGPRWGNMSGNPGSFQSKDSCEFRGVNLGRGQAQ